MIDLRIIYDVEGWAYSHAARALRQHAPSDFQVTIAPLQSADGELDAARALGSREPDIVFTMHTSPRMAAAVQEKIHALSWHPAQVGAWNRGYPLSIEQLPLRHEQVDALLINNEIMWQKLSHLDRLHLAPNGVDLAVFRVSNPLRQREARVLWCGSEFWREVKGYDDILLPLQSRLRSRGIQTDFRLVNSHGPDKWTASQMADWYNSGQVILCASTTEGTPNTTLEGAACGCVVVSTPVGNMPELLINGKNGFLVERSVESMETAVLTALSDYQHLANQLLADIQAWSWEYRSVPFFRAFRSALELHRNKHNAAPSVFSGRL